MDDTEDDARYPPDSHPSALHRSHRASFIRGKQPFVRGGPFPPRVPGRDYPSSHLRDDVDSDDEPDDGDEEGPAGPADDIDPGEEEEVVEEEEEEGEEEEDDEEVEEDDEEVEEERGAPPRYRDHSPSSPESRGKRRKLDRYALGFEFAPRAVSSSPLVQPPPRAHQQPPRAPIVRNNVADWSEDSTFVLLDAWGELFVKNGRKSLRSDEWSEVARKVNRASRATPRSDSQCRNRIDTLKKKYKKEREARPASAAIKGGYRSEWVYFTRMEELMDAPLLRQPLRLPCGVDSGEFVFTESGSRLNRPNGLDELMDSPAGSESMGGDDDEDDSDGLPPPSIKPRRRRSRGFMDVASFRLLADSIRRFGEVYEKIENNKRQHMADLEKMRREFQRDLEVQKREILERAQVELSKIGQEEEEDGEEENDCTNNGREVNGSVNKIK